jgi:hypothetical protein
MVLLNNEPHDPGDQRLGAIRSSEVCKRYSSILIHYVSGLVDYTVLAYRSGLQSSFMRHALCMKTSPVRINISLT